MGGIADIGTGAVTGLSVGGPWGALIGAGIGGLKAAVTGIKKSRLKDQLDKQWDQRPVLGSEYLKPYEDVLAKYQQAQSGNMPGYEQTLAQVGQLGARSRGAAERGAISSNAYGAQVGDIYQKELDALQNLGVKQAEYKSSMLDKTAGAQIGLAGAKAEQWNQNVNLPWQQKRNEMTSLNEAEQTNDANSWDTFQSSLMNFAGTKYYTDMLKKMYPQGSTGGVVGKGGVSNPIQGYNPQQNLLNSVGNMAKKTPIKPIFKYGEDY